MENILKDSSEMTFSQASEFKESRFNKLKQRCEDYTSERKKWRNRNWYYHKCVRNVLKFIIPEGYEVLDVGCEDGTLLDELKPSKGVGIDASPSAISQARSRFPNFVFHEAFAENFKINETFDYVVLTNIVGFLDDVQLALSQCRKVCKPQTRLVIHYYNYLWEPILSLGDKLGLRMKQGVQNWLSLEDLENLLNIAGFETVRKTKKLLFPFYIPILSTLINKIIGNLPFINQLCLAEFIVARPKGLQRKTRPSVSIMVPTKDEKGNIRELIERTPEFPGAMEMVFVDGNSTDGTVEEIKACINDYPHKNIRFLSQGNTKGKGAAVRIGFEASKGDILMILDSDISVAPEDTLKFYQLLESGSGELINGSRLVYPMERHAMRFLNILGNKFFSMMFSYLLGQRLKDTLCGTKALYKTDYEKIAENRAFFGDFDPFGDFDLLFGAAKLNMKILELPVRYYERRYGDIKIHRFRHGTLLLGMCLIAIRRLKFI